MTDEDAQIPKKNSKDLLATQCVSIPIRVVIDFPKGIPFWDKMDNIFGRKKNVKR